MNFPSFVVVNLNLFVSSTGQTTVAAVFFWFLANRLYCGGYCDGWGLTEKGYNDSRTEYTGLRRNVTMSKRCPGWIGGD